MRRLDTNRRNHGATALFCMAYLALFALACGVLYPSTTFAAYPAPWPSSWTAYTAQGTAIQDLSDPNGDGTYGVSATPGAVDFFNGTSGTLPTVYYAYDSTNQVFFVRMRMREDPYKTSGTQGPWVEYAWHIVFDLTGDGYKDFVFVLDGKSGSQQSPYDDIEAYYHPLARRQDFNSSPCASGGDLVWIHDSTDGSACCDFKYSRRVDESGTGGGYLVDVQIPLTAFVNCSGQQILTETTPFMLVFTTSTQNNNPTAKDLVSPGTYSMDASISLPSGDVTTLRDGTSQAPMLTDLRASCAGSTMTLTTYTMDTIQVSGGNVVDTINNVTYYYKNGSTWTQIGSPVTTPNTSTVNEWAINWNTTGLSGLYPLRIVITDDQTNATTDEHWAANVTTCGLSPLLVTFKSFKASRLGDAILVEWETSSEVGTVGFYLYRQGPSNGEFVPIHREMLPGLLHSPQGGIYRVVDDQGIADRVTYLVVEVDAKGQERSYGPITVRVEERPVNLSGKYISLAPQEAGRLRFSREPHPATPRETQGEYKGEAGKAGASLGGRLKIGISETGIYYLSAEQMAAPLGLSKSQVQSLMSRGGLALTNLGQIIPYHVATGNAGIYFYGQKPESIYTNENVYWLYQGRGRRMEQVPGVAPVPAVGEENFAQTLHFEEDRYPVTSLSLNPRADYWFWDYVVAADPTLGRKTFTLRTPGVATTTQEATLVVSFQGLTDTQSGVPDHHAIVTLNGMPIGETQWTGHEARELILKFAQNLLLDGDNVVEVQGMLDPPVPYSVFYVDSFDIAYQRTYRAVDDRLVLRGETHPVVTIGGYSSQEIFVFDITDGKYPKLLTGTTKDAVDGRYRVSFTPSSPQTLYVATAQGGCLFHGSMVSSALNSLKGRTTGADYVAITPERLKETAKRLTDYRRAQGHRVELVTLEAIYDEFSYGIVNPESIKKFLVYAYQNWAVRPRYVVLVGSGTFDYRNIQGKGDNLLPALLVNTPYGLFASDNEFGDVAGDDAIPEIAVGRLPVLTAAELDAVINKIILYENEGSLEWTQRVLLLADNADDSGDFPAASDALLPLFPPGYTLEKVYLSEQPIDVARGLLMTGVNEGVAFLNFIGHGGYDRFAQEGLLVTADISSFTNSAHLPVVAAMTCLVNRFEIPGVDALGEELILYGDGGAVAVWGPNGLVLYQELVVLDQAFFEAIFDPAGGTRILGDAILRALQAHQISGGEPSARLTYSLLGDPGLNLR